MRDVTMTREEAGDRRVAPLPAAIGYCGDCNAALYRRCELCGESEADHPAYCDDPLWTKHVPDLCLRCEEIAERACDEDDPWDTGGDGLDD